RNGGPIGPIEGHVTLEPVKIDELLQPVDIDGPKHALIRALIGDEQHARTTDGHPEVASLPPLRGSSARKEMKGYSSADSAYAGGRRGKERAARNERSSDWRRGAQRPRPVPNIEDHLTGWILWMMSRKAS